MFLIYLFPETMFMQSSPSVLACSCICAATRGIKAPSAKFSLHDVCRLTQCDPLEVELTVRHIEKVVAEETAAMQKQYGLVKVQQYPMIPGKMATGMDCGELGQPETPTDVQDVYL